MRIELARLHEELRATMVYVTHDQVEAMTMADKIVVLQVGRVEQVGSPLELYHHPANLFVAGFIGSPRMNMLPARVVGADRAGVAVELASGARVAVSARPGAARPGDAVTLGVRPEALRPHPDGTLAGEVRLVERLGGLTLLHVALQGARTSSCRSKAATAAARTSRYAWRWIQGRATCSTRPGWCWRSLSGTLCWRDAPRAPNPGPAPPGHVRRNASGSSIARWWALPPCRAAGHGPAAVS